MRRSRPGSLLALLLTLSINGWVSAQRPALPPPLPTLPAPGAQSLPIASAESTDRVLPINLATALQLSSARPLDVQIATRQISIAARQLDRAKLTWVPNLVAGMDYFRHEGGQQNFTGDVVNSSRGSFAAGIGPNIVFNMSDAIYAPLVAKQDLRARRAQHQAISNDSTLAVAETYFTVQQARGELAGALLALQKAEEASDKAEKLADGLAPPLEASRARVELARRKQIVSVSRERWRVASAELVRLLRLEPGTLIEPMEPPFLPVTVIDSTASVDTLIPIGLTNRPELASYQAVVQAAIARLKQEKLRPLVPSLALRSVSTNPSGSLGLGGFGGGPNGYVGNFGSRFDIDVQVLWEFQSLGFGNKARVGERKAEQEAATLELFRMQDRVAAEVSTAYAQVKSSQERMLQSEPALKDALELVEKSLQGMTQTRRIGTNLTLVVRPQEVVAAIQALGQANADYFAAVGDYNRAQFRLYRALGHPGHSLADAVPKIGQEAVTAALPTRNEPPTAIPPAGLPILVTPPGRNPPSPPDELPPARTSRVDDISIPLPHPIAFRPAQTTWSMPITRQLLASKPPTPGPGPGPGSGPVQQVEYRSAVAPVPKPPQDYAWQPVIQDPPAGSTTTPKMSAPPANHDAPKMTAVTPADETPKLTPPTGTEPAPVKDVPKPATETPIAPKPTESPKLVPAKAPNDDGVKWESIRPAEPVKPKKYLSLFR